MATKKTASTKRNRPGSSKKARPGKSDARTKQKKPEEGASSNFSGFPFFDLLKNAAENAQKNMQTDTAWLDGQRAFWEKTLAEANSATAPGATTAPSWVEMLHKLSSRPAPSAPPPFPGIEAFLDPVGLWAQLPGIGYHREHHENNARLHKAFHAYEEASRAYTADMARALLAAFGHFEASLRREPAPQSIKDIYVRWFDAGEKAYADHARSDLHAERYGALVNAMAALRKELNTQTDRWATALHLPTRAEVDSLHKALHEIKRENRKLKRETVKEAAKKDKTVKKASKKTTGKRS